VSQKIYVNAEEVKQAIIHVAKNIHHFHHGFMGMSTPNVATNILGEVAITPLDGDPNNRPIISGSYIFSEYKKLGLNKEKDGDLDVLAKHIIEKKMYTSPVYFGTYPNMEVVHVETQTLEMDMGCHGTDMSNCMGAF